MGADRRDLWATLLLGTLCGALVAGSAMVALWIAGSPREREAPAAVRGSNTLARVPARAGRVPDGGEAQEVRQTGIGTLLPRELPSVSSTPDYSYNNVDPQAREKGRYDARELAVLQEIIDLNGLTENSSKADFDDGDGVFEPLEFGTQVWCGGHLRELYAGPSEYFSFGYPLRRLPATLGDLRQLTRLNLNSSRLEELPPSIAELRELRVLELYDNQLRELPEALGSLGGLEVLQVRGNRLREIPRAVTDLPKLAALFASDNPLARPPGVLRAAVARSSAPDPHVVRRSADCSPES